MAERIINITCPNCKHGIKHDTLMNTTSCIPPEEYPEVNETGRCWCKACQHGTFPTEDGLCTECLDKHRETRLRPVVKNVVTEKVIKVENEIVKEKVEEKPEVKNSGVTLDSIKTSTKKSSTPKVLR